MNVFEKLSHWSSAFRPEGLPKSALETAKHCIIDLCGVTLAGSQTQVAQLVQHTLLDLRGKGLVPIIGTNLRTGSDAAAMANAVAAHSLDFDDNCYAGWVHGSAVLVPSLLSLAACHRTSGMDLILSLIVGYEIMGRIGKSVSDLFNHGWLTTSVLGTIGAAAACARLLGLDDIQTKNAMGLALCQAGGMRQNNGTPAKPYTVGRAAENAVIAVQMARNGLESSGEILEGSEGFFQIYGRGQMELSCIQFIGNPLIIQEPGICFKAYPICSSAHAAVDAVLALKNEHHIDWHRITRVECMTTPAAIQFLRCPDAKNALEAQFSLPFAIASALIKGGVRLNCLDDAFVQALETRSLMAKVNVVATEDFGSGKGTHEVAPEGAEIHITVESGEIFKHFVGHAKGFAENPFSWEEVSDKFTQCAHGVLPLQKSKGFLQIAASLETAEELSPLFEMLIP